MVSVSKQRIKKVFDNSLKNVSNGKQPNVSLEMRKQGYSPSSCRSQKVTQTKTWEQLLNRIQDDKIINKLNEIALDNEDKRACLSAIDIILKLKDKYPAQKKKILGLFDKLSDLEPQKKE